MAVYKHSETHSFESYFDYEHFKAHFMKPTDDLDEQLIQWQSLVDEVTVQCNRLRAAYPSAKVTQRIEQGVLIINIAYVNFSGGYYAAASASEEFENAVLQRPAWRIVG
ncbi:hypothetical protein PMW_67 [Pseudomonas phage phiPMW]|uniref:Uncharacterized protein n=1 Tax=Pseudomonas phage phiPMW TaxID=1815582 RepID=A0A1S5R197_9CAUD|nr:hypothetical protein FDG97_gp067 [Pseudomonas phage phiPMW]ANA49192.1 hypothetical protein PMW_67 [Pseudomonas phage phiPMW]